MEQVLSITLLPQRIKSKIVIGRETDCWNWTAGKAGRGYGQISWKNKPCYAHRVVWELLRGPIPEGLVCDHYRLNPGERSAPCSITCVNPDHIELVSSQENTNRGRAPEAARVRMQGNTWNIGHTRSIGEKHSRSKLTNSQVIEISRRYAGGEKGIDLAKAYGVSQPCISSIISGERWKHLNLPDLRKKRLTKAQKMEIRDEHKAGALQKDLAAKYKVSQGAISYTLAS